MQCAGEKRSHHSLGLNLDSKLGEPKLRVPPCLASSISNVYLSLVHLASPSQACEVDNSRPENVAGGGQYEARFGARFGALYRALGANDSVVRSMWGEASASGPRRGLVLGGTHRLQVRRLRRVGYACQPHRGRRFSHHGSVTRSQVQVLPRPVRFSGGTANYRSHTGPACLESS
jgi:hypothetical protein